jgi:hypothetical protein
MEKTAKVATVGIALIILSASITFVVVRYYNPFQTTPYRVYYSNPVVGKYPYIQGGHSFLATNGFAYSYVIFDTTHAENESTFVMLPALNVQLASISNLTAIVTYREFNASRGPPGPGISFTFWMPSIGVTYGAGGDLAGLGGSCSSSEGCFYIMATGTTLLKVFFYGGPADMPGPPQN